MSVEPELQAYFQESQSWEADRAEQQPHEQQRWWAAGAG